MSYDSFVPVGYSPEFQPLLVEFLSLCLPESGRCLDISGRHSYYEHISSHFIGFWCMFDNGRIIGTVALSELNSESCELKSLYLLQKYHGMGYGKMMLAHAISAAKSAGYKKMFLDSLSTSTRAVALYRKMGFTDTEKYNSSQFSDVFMMLEL